MLPIRTILHPTDFTEQARDAFALASALARDYGAHLIVLHVAARPVMVPMEGVAIPQMPEDQAKVREELQALQVSGAKVPVTHELIEGNPTTEIVRIAEETRADLIVMGTHGRRGLGRLLLGSIAETVVRNAPCPVLTVKKPIPAWTASSEAATHAPSGRPDPSEFWAGTDVPRAK